jgi:radical SAM protein, TIGR01212 family
MDNKRYNTFNDELKRHFKQKVVKLSLDGGFTCPTRDNTKGSGGCIFCSQRGSGEFAGLFENIEAHADDKLEKINLDAQIKNQISLLSKKWNNVKYIAYFQNYTNTYEKPSYLNTLYQKALSVKDVVGLDIATRPDCLGDDVLEVLDYYNKKTYLIVELGLQSIHEKSEKFIRRGYDITVFEEAVEKLRKLNIQTVVHTIVGLPTEDKEDMLQTYRYLNNVDIQGVKIQQLNILKNTDLEKYYEKNKFSLMGADEYIEFVCDIIQILRDDIVIHRLTGDGAKDELIEPKWILNKRYVLNGIDKVMKQRNAHQGDRYR